MANEVQSIVEDVVLEPGCNIIMIKVFEGAAARLPSPLPDAPATRSSRPIFTNPECPAVAAAPGSVAADQRLRRSQHHGRRLRPQLPLPGRSGAPCQDAADSDDNGQLNITDGVRILNYLFLGGPAPPAPGPDSCGPDPTSDDDLPTCVYTAC